MPAPPEAASRPDWRAPTRNVEGVYSKLRPNATRRPGHLSTGRRINDPIRYKNQDPCPGFGLKNFLNLSGVVRNWASSSGTSPLWLMFGHFLANSAFIATKGTDTSSVSGRI